MCTDAYPRSHLTTTKGDMLGRMLRNSTFIYSQPLSRHGPEHCPAAAYVVKLLMQSLQSFGSGRLQLPKTLPRHGSRIDTGQRSFPLGNLDMAALSQRREFH